MIQSHADVSFRLIFGLVMYIYVFVLQIPMQERAAHWTGDNTVVRVLYLQLCGFPFSLYTALLVHILLRIKRIKRNPNL